MVDGDPVLATRTLRDDFETASQAEREATARAAEPPPAKVKAVRLLTPDDAPVTEVAAAGDGRVQVDVEATSRQDDWILGIGIDTASGQNVYGTNTQMLDVRLPPLIGRSTYEFRLRHLNPGPGDYTVHSAVARWSGPRIPPPAPCGDVQRPWRRPYGRPPRSPGDPRR